MERPLALHESALSEPEYQAYTCILHEIAPETAGVEWEAAQVPMGEAKGWIRGKYAVDAALLDQRQKSTLSKAPVSLLQARCRALRVSLQIQAWPR
ncbi:hypothetical protein M407DRAFT_17981 [Tulasnella calospora MUT 4182]|uniref:Uncharacterized protein n=1 Tax=Tulasnella calospora MUT 4182 TaxID=1051891 RepID=A0A0C3QUM1_9AGAM|nr:hypothetical protein M407DRAFT_17981 [Tulasnella calospora MUT 4182]